MRVRASGESRMVGHPAAADRWRENGVCRTDRRRPRRPTTNGVSVAAAAVLAFRHARGACGHEDADAGGEPAVLRPRAVAPARFDRSRARARRRHPARARDRRRSRRSHRTFVSARLRAAQSSTRWCRSGLLERLSPSGMEYGITDKFRVLAQARVIQPLPRRDAQMLVAHIVDTAGRFNRTAVTNKYEIAAIAVFGSYMSLDRGSDRRVGRRDRPPSPACATADFGARITHPSEGTEAHPRAARAAELVPARELLQAASGRCRGRSRSCSRTTTRAVRTFEAHCQRPSGWRRVVFGPARPSDADRSHAS